MNKIVPKIIIISMFVAAIVFVVLFIYNKQRKYLEFTYITESDYTNLDYFAHYNFPKDCEFTWWWDFPYPSVDTIKFINDTFGTKFSEEIADGINIEEHNFIISFGRKLKMIYYDETMEPQSKKGRYAKSMIIAVPVFEEDYNHKIYLYITDKYYNIYPEEFISDDIINFNMYGDVRYEEEER